MNIAFEISERNRLTADMIHDAALAVADASSVISTLEFITLVCGAALSDTQAKDNRDLSHFMHFNEICFGIITRDAERIENMLIQAWRAAASEEPFQEWKRQFDNETKAQDEEQKRRMTANMKAGMR